MITRQFLHIQFKLEACVTVLAYSAAAISLLSDIIGRELFEHGIWGAQRFAVYAAIIAGFLGMVLAAAENSLIRPQILDFVIPLELEQGFKRLADFVSALLYGGLGYLAVNFVWEGFINGDVAPVLDWPLWPVQLILPYAFMSVSLRFLLQSFDPSLKITTVRVGEEL